MWWRRLRLRACPPASRSPRSAPGKSPRCRTPGTGSHPAPQHLGNLGGAEHFRPSATQRTDSPGEGSRTGLLGDGVSRPWALQGRGGGWTETSAFKSFVSKLSGAWRPRGRPPGNKHRPVLAFWSPDPGRRSSVAQGVHHACAARARGRRCTQCRTSKAALPPLAFYRGGIRLRECLSRGRRSQRRPGPPLQHCAKRE